LSYGPPPLVHIHYRRPPDRLEIFKQFLLHEGPDVRITYEPHLPISAPKWIGSDLVMEPGSPVVWFTFPGAWHDIGRFHGTDGTFTGLYANVLTPPVFVDRLTWHTTDLFLDIWLPDGGPLHVLDLDEFREAARQGIITESEVAAAEVELSRIEAAARRGDWPPEIVHTWDLEKARAQL